MSAAYASRFEAVFLCTHSRGPKLTSAKAARYMAKSEAFVRKWVKRYKESKDVDDLPDRGKARATTPQVDKMIVNLFKNNSSYTLPKVQSILAKKKIDVSLTTIKRRLFAAGFRWRSTMLKPFLKSEHIEKRLAWAQKHADRDWSNVIFTDETSFWAWTVRKHEWAQRGQRVPKRTVKHATKIHAWGCVCRKGFGRLILFTENLNAVKMLGLYKKGLLKSSEKWFGTDNSTWILQEDNDPKHRSKLCTNWKKEQGITTLDWPAQTPDANPIENVWSVMKRKLQDKDTFTLKPM